ncbi:hypothetical protein [Pseudomonas chlororaphis]|nr:hypothetical protein [Pseudomonas chlororaphis]AZD28482.1 hypothetical protein C4K23_1717 [Pseudomonas chlororaphis]ETD37964.1 hypothetical protein U724_16605 [Pseudomonas chlororaphis subsp. aurantiaca PB-St2]
MSNALQASTDTNAALLKALDSDSGGGIDVAACPTARSRYR